MPTLVQGRSWAQPVRRCKRKRTNQRKRPKVRESAKRGTCPALSASERTQCTTPHTKASKTQQTFGARRRGVRSLQLGAGIVSPTTFARCATVTNDGRRARSLWRSFRERQKPRRGPPRVHPREVTGRNTKNKMSCLEKSCFASGRSCSP